MLKETNHGYLSLRFWVKIIFTIAIAIWDDEKRGKEERGRGRRKGRGERRGEGKEGNFKFQRE